MQSTIKCCIGIFFIGTLLNYVNAHQVQKHVPAEVPVEFQEHYTQLETKLDELNDYLAAQWDGTKHPVIFSTELLAASTNRGEKILDPLVFEAIKLNLDAFLTLGVSGISFDIKYPSLTPPFPRWDEYLEFYRNVAQEVRNRNFTLFVAMQTAFTDSIFGHLGADYTGLTLEQYKTDKRQMAEIIIRELQPDYLTIEAEPTTQAMNTGLDFSVENVVDIVTFVLDGLDKQGTLIGAGAGSWEDMNYIQRLSEDTDIDYLDIHVYAINYDFVIDRLETIHDIAQTHDLKVVIGESWLYKNTAAELADPSVTHLDIYPRDVFGFWIPLDQKYLEMMVSLSHYLEFEFTSLFWMRYFWGYIAYTDETKDLSATSRYNRCDDVAAFNMLAGNLTPTGQTYQNLIGGNTSVELTDSYAPEIFILHQNYPNPFNAETTIPYYVHQDSRVILDIYDIMGRCVRRLIDERKSPGNYSLVWDGRSDSGMMMTSGTYICQMSTGNIISRRKFILLK